MLKFFSGLVILLIGGLLYLHYVRDVPMPFLPATPETAFERGKNLTQAYCIPSENDAENRQRGMEALKFAAENGHIEAAALYGERLLSTDEAEAIKWLEVAGEHGQSVPAVQLCGHYYLSKTGQNYTKALKWCQAAAGYGFYNTDIWLSEIYSRGLGVKPDIEEAYFWISLANYWSVNSNDIGYSPDKMREIAQLLPPEKRKTIDERVRKWSPKASSNTGVPNIAEHCEKILAEKRAQQPVSDDIAKQCLKRCTLQLKPPDLRFLEVKDCPYWTYPNEDLLVKRSTGEINTWP